MLRMGNIQDGQLDWENLVYTDDKDEIAKYLLKNNDVLFNRTNSPELVGKTAIYKSEMPAIFAGYLIRIHRKEDLLDGDFLNYFLNSQRALDYGKTVVIASTPFSDFIRNASSAEKKRVYTEVMKRAAASQNATLRAAITAGVASGPGKSADAVFDRLEAKYRKLT